MIANDDLSDRLVDIEQSIKELKTSQAIGQSSIFLVKVADVDLSKTYSGYFFPWFYAEFRSNEKICPLIMPRLTLYLNGSKIAGVIDYNRYNVLNQLSLSDPYLAAFDVRLPGDYIPPSSGTVRIVGQIYANCYGVMSRMELTNGQ